jgi:hypothetical protein
MALLIWYHTIQLQITRNDTIKRAAEQSENMKTRGQTNFLSLERGHGNTKHCTFLPNVST